MRMVIAFDKSAAVMRQLSTNHFTPSRTNRRFRGGYSLNGMSKSSESGPTFTPRGCQGIFSAGGLLNCCFSVRMV